MFDRIPVVLLAAVVLLPGPDANAPTSPGHPALVSVAVDTESRSADAAEARARIAALLAESHSLCVVSPDPTLDLEVARKLTAWERLQLVETPAAADLVLTIERRRAALETASEFRESEPAGVTFSARLTHSRSGVELWSTKKGATWTASDARGRWAGRQIAEAFTKYFDTALPRPGQTSPKR
jgi:hypothetical protein